MFKFIEVFSPPGNSVGKVTYDKINRKFVIWDITGLEILFSVLSSVVERTRTSYYMVKSQYRI